MNFYVNYPGNYIETNKFSYLVAKKNDCEIIFCKTDYLNVEFDRISKLNHKVILLTGNSDFPIIDWHVKNAPKNLIKLYGQNVLCNDSRFIPVPMGLESSVVARRGIKHGVFYDRSRTLQDLLLTYTKPKLDTSTAKNFIYSNFSIHTNSKHRQQVQDYIRGVTNINSSSRKSVSAFHEDILSHKITLCPVGNGLDTHRLWEVIYLNRVPLVIKSEQNARQGFCGDLPNYKNYSIYDKLYKELPIILLDELEQLKDVNLINSLYEQAKTKCDQMAYFSYWKDVILSNI